MSRSVFVPKPDCTVESGDCFREGKCLRACSGVESRVAAKLKERAEIGLAKYGTTMERTDLSRLDWLRHAQEEAMDLAVYLQKLIDLEATNAPR